MNFSIITATYNSYPAIKDCIGSIAQQTVRPEHLIIDGQSKDETLTTIKNSPSVSRYISEPDKGIYDAPLVRDCIAFPVKPAIKNKE